MKKAFVSITLCASICAGAIAAQLAAVLPIDLFSVEAIAGIYVVGGVLVIAFTEARLSSKRHSPRRNAPAARNCGVPSAVTHIWQTVSG